MTPPAVPTAPALPADPATAPLRFRHRWEMPLVWLSALIALGTLVFAALILLGMATGGTGLVDQTLEEEGIDFVGYAMLLLLAPLVIFVTRFYQIAAEKANAVRVGPEQFPELWALYNDIAARLGMTDPPRLYLRNGDGVINAYALSCNKQFNYVILHAEIAQLLAVSPQTVGFVLAHELSHHRLRHVSLMRLVVTTIVRLIPILGTSQIRAQEYSADRLARAVCADHTSTISLLMVGPWVNGEVNHAALHRQACEEKDEWFVRLANLTSSHAVGVKRYDALKRIDAEGFGAHGEMF